jgi:hypothetical protein
MDGDNRFRSMGRSAGHAGMRTHARTLIMLAPPVPFLAPAEEGERLAVALQ